MEIIVSIALVIVVSTPFLDKLSNLLSNLTNLVKQLNSSKSKGLLEDGKNIQLSLTVGSENKRNLCRKHKSPKKR